MRLSCGITIVNRFATSLGMKNNQKFKNALLAVMKPSKEDTVFILLVTSKNKSGTRYRVRGNIENIFGQFKNEGKSTIRFKEPPHDILIHTADKIQLGNFMVFLKKVLKNEIKDVPEISKLNGPLLKNSVGHKMEIKKKSEYPTMQGFPSNLQVLVISNCHLKRVDNRIFKLKSLTTLCIDHNNLTDVPLELRRLPLKILSLSCNNLGKNFLSWKFLSWPLSECLEYLNLSGNEMKYFPTSLVRFNKLKVLKMSSVSAKKIPHRLFLLSNLQELDLSKNMLQALPGTIIKRYKKFDKLDLSENDLQCTTNFINQYCMPTECVLSLIELSIRSILENKLFYNELILPNQVIPLLDQTKLCCCGKICSRDFGPIHAVADPKSLANTLIYSHRIHTIPIIYQACSPQHFHKKW